MGIDENVLEILKNYLSQEEIELLSKINGKPINDSQLVEWFYGENIKQEKPDEVKQLERRIRKILFKLESLGLVKGMRTEENRVYWKLHENPYKGIVTYIKNKIVELESKKVFYKNETLFFCSVCGSEYSFSEAFSLGFVCSSCGSALEEYNTEEKISEIEKEIENLKKVLNKLSQYI